MLIGISKKGKEGKGREGKGSEGKGKEGKGKESSNLHLLWSFLEASVVWAQPGFSKKSECNRI